MRVRGGSSVLAVIAQTDSEPTASTAVVA